MRYHCVLIFLLFAAAAAHAQTPIRIGTCNVAKVFEGLDERKDIDARIKANVQAHNAEVSRRRKSLEEIQSQRDELKPDSPLYQQKTEELVQAATQLEVMMKLKEMELIKLEKQHTARLYEQVRAACKSAAAAHKLDLIVAERPPESSREIARLSPDQLKLLLSTSEVLYASNQHDLTQEIILTLNKQFAAPK
jgi:Skp family chaperone for outer membrane proteins